MGLFTTNNQEVGIGDLTIGINAQGMQEYKDQLQTELLINTKEKLEDVVGIQTAIDAGWQGEARDHFLEALEKTIKTIEEDLEKEYKDLEARFEELESNYFGQDRKMME